MILDYGSVASGIEAATVAWHPLGWRAAWLAEIDAFPSAVLAHHYPDVPNLGDMTTIAARVLAGSVPAPAALVGGTPCQAFSVAGMRKSLADERGNLTLRFVELADAIDDVRIARGDNEAIIVWENVPGVLSTDDNAFGCFLAGLAGEDEPLVAAGKKWSNAGCVYGPKRAIAWRTLDAQYFGLAQRRRRVFVIASARYGVDPAEILFEWQGVRRDTAPRRTAGQDAAASLTASAGHHGYSSPRGDGSDNLIASTLLGSARRAGGYSYDDAPLVAGTLQSGGKAAGSATQQVAESGLLIAFGGNNTSGAIDVATALTAHGGTGRHDFESETFLAFDSRQDTVSSTEVFGALGSSSPQAQAVAVALRGRDGGATAEIGDECAFTVRASSGGGDKPHMLSKGSVRRLTPTECERLQGFPDGYTAIPWDGWRKMDATETPESCRADGMQVRQAKKSGRWYVKDVDGPRYKALGNSMATNVMAWIGRRINDRLDTLSADHREVANG